MTQRLLPALLASGMLLGADFGEPHIVRYCAVHKDGRLVTNRENRALRCGRDGLSQSQATGR